METRTGEFVIRCTGVPEGYYDEPDLTPMDFRWGWPEEYQMGDHYQVFDHPRLYLRLDGLGIPRDTEWVRCTSPCRDDVIWRVTGQRHPTEDAVLAVWPD